MVRHVVFEGCTVEANSDWIKPVYHAAPDHPSYQQLKSSGLEVVPLPLDSIESGTVLIPSRNGSLYELVAVVDRLLGPGGCPWDVEQTHESLKKHLVEETYEVLDAIDRGDINDLREELGDLILQPIMHAQMESRDGSWDIDAVADSVTEKLVRRHPHVFGDAAVADADEVLRNWDQIKKAEKNNSDRSILSGIPRAMPSLLRALQVSKRAARAGFEWPDIEGVFAKLREEELEFREALSKNDVESAESEAGDLLFTVVNLARWAGIEPEEALRKMLDRFTMRFEIMEKTATVPLSDLSPEEWDRLWSESKFKSVNSR